MDSLKQYIDLYEEHRTMIKAGSSEAMNAPREAALERLKEERLPEKGDEGYPALSVAKMFEPNYGMNLTRLPFQANPAETFRCGVPNITTQLALVVNDTYAPTEGLKRNLPMGVTVCPLSQGGTLVEKYYNRLAAEQGNAVTDLNTLLAQEGVLVHVEAGVHLEKPLQIVNIFNSQGAMLAMRRVLIVLEEESSVAILSCDHSVAPGIDYLNCQVIEAYLGKGASLEFVDMEESTPSTGRCSQLFASQDENSELNAYNITLMSGRTRNSAIVDLNGRGAKCRLGGMVTASEEQMVDNFTRVKHHAEDCHSDQMYKYIVDDRAECTFYGTIVVDEAARFTKAYQSNRNILASPDAAMHTRPQLEIYCDEVKCSHGATVGQLDANALFYMQSRGIPQAQARMMLMQAFMADVIDSITLPALQSRLHQLVERRLAGAPELCSGCS